MSKQNQSIKAIHEFGKTYESIGPEKIIKVLQNARQINDQADPHIAFTIQLVCNHFQLAFETILEERGAQDNITYSRAFIIFYLREEFKTPWPQIRVIFKGRDQSALYKCGVLIKELDKRLEHHKSYILAKENFDIKLKQYKQTFK